MNEVVELLRAANARPVLVFDETDAWLQTVDIDRHRLASAFFAGPFRALAKEIDVGVVIAVHTFYNEVPEYRSAQELLDATIDLPRFHGRATEALSAILTKRVQTELGEQAHLA